MYRSLMYRGIDKRRCIYVSYLALRGFGRQLKVASVYSTATSIEVAMLSDVTAIEHSYTAMLVVKEAVILLVWAIKSYQTTIITS